LLVLSRRRLREPEDQRALLERILYGNADSGNTSCGVRNPWNAFSDISLRTQPGGRVTVKTSIEVVKIRSMPGSLNRENCRDSRFGGQQQARAGYIPPLRAPASVHYQWGGSPRQACATGLKPNVTASQ
jgi:hypothetical protein